MNLAVALKSSVSTITLRWYQQAAVDAVFRIWGEDETASPLIVIPTGGGKSLTLAEICRRFAILYPGQRILSVVHVRELVSQNYLSFRKTAPDLSAGIFSASLGRRDRSSLVTFCTVQSVVRAIESFANVGLIIIDEAHLVPHSDDGQYKALINGIRALNPRLKVAGCTATPYRQNSGNLCEPYGDNPAIFSEVAFELTVLQLLREGYLCPAVAKATKIRMNTDGVKQRGGEFVESELDKKLNNDKLNAEIIEDVIAQTEDRRSVLIFGISVDHAQRLRDHLRRKGETAELVTGQTPKFERDRILRDFKAGRIKYLTNCAVLTTGFDAPETDCVVFARPTNSPGLYLQMAGRGLRIAPGKANVLILDYAGNTMRHGLVDQVKGVFKRSKGKKQDPDASASIKECPECFTMVASDAKKCPCCDHEFAPSTNLQDREAKLFKKQTAGKVSTDLGELHEFYVMRADFVTQNSKSNNTPMFGVVFHINGGLRITEWLCFDHRTDTGAPAWNAKKARETWRRMTVTGTPPKTVSEALERRGEIVCPSRIWARQDGNFWRIEGSQA